jgi:hypothetical protein
MCHSILNILDRYMGINRSSYRERWKFGVSAVSVTPFYEEATVSFALDPLVFKKPHFIHVEEVCTSIAHFSSYTRSKKLFQR